MRYPASLFALTLFAVTGLHAQVPAAITSDPPPDKQFPAHVAEMRIPSHGEQLLGQYLFAAGQGPHPTAILFHGFPGYEQNLDIAQSLRRAGYNVLFMHYRGSWGVKGTFSFTHVQEDADTEVAFLLDPTNAEKYHVDTHHLIAVGHSMGGYLAASATAHNPAIYAAVLISAWNIPNQVDKFNDGQLSDAIAVFSKANPPERLLPLNTTATDLATELFQHRTQWQLANLALGIGQRPILVLTSNDGLVPGNEALMAALKKNGNTRITTQHFETDHTYNGQRIALQTTILNWLAKL